MFCVECGKEIPDAVKFCPDCGTSQIRVVDKPVKAKPKKKALPKKGKRYYSKLKIPELKEILKEKKLPISGYKPELIERLTDPNWREKQKKPLDIRREKQKKPLDIPFDRILLFLGIPFLIIALVLGIKNSAGIWETAGMFLGGVVLLFFLKIYFTFTLAFMDNPLYYVKKLSPSKGKASIKGLGILVGSLVIIWGVFVLVAQTEYNDSVDNLNEVYDKNEEVYEAAGFEKPDAEKEYGAYVGLGVGIVIFLFCLSRS